MKIAVIGYSGSGKSTLTATLGRYYHLPVLHLDCVQFLPGWQIRSAEEKLAMVRDFLDSNDSWVIDGTYSRLYFDERMADADQIVFLNFPRLACLCRAFRRYLHYRGKSRASIAAGCDEKFDLEFAWWILYKGRTRKQKQLFADVVHKYSGKTTVIRNQRQLDRFTQNIT